VFIPDWSQPCGDQTLIGTICGEAASRGKTERPRVLAGADAEQKGAVVNIYNLNNIRLFQKRLKYTNN